MSRGLFLYRKVPRWRKCGLLLIPVETTTDTKSAVTVFDRALASGPAWQHWSECEPAWGSSPWKSGKDLGQIQQRFATGLFGARGKQAERPGLRPGEAEAHMSAIVAHDTAVGSRLGAYVLQGNRCRLHGTV